MKVSVKQPMLERPRINSLLEKAVKFPIVYVKAGEGCGKSTAINSFLAGRDENIIRINLSHKDNDPWHFWENICLSMGETIPAAGKYLEGIGFPQSESQLIRCLSALSPAGKKKTIVAIDNCHLIDNKTIISIAKCFLSDPIDNTCCILITESEPKLNTMSYISKGNLFRINTEDLWFNRDEITAYFNLLGMDLTQDEEEKISRDTEGWIMAIGLIAEKMKSKNSSYDPSVNTKTILKNIEEYYFSAIPPSLKKMLVLISLLDEWPMAALEKIALSMQEELPPDDELEKHLGFLSPLLRYNASLQCMDIHGSFLNFLREKQTTLSKNEIKKVYFIKASWCFEQRLFTEAALNYARAGDYRGLIESIHSYPRLMSLGPASFFLELLEKAIRENENTEEKNEDFLILKHVVRAGLLLNLGYYAQSIALLEENILLFEDIDANKSMKPIICLILSASYNFLAALTIMTYPKNRDLKKTVGYFKKGNDYIKNVPSHMIITGDPLAKVYIVSYINMMYPSPVSGEYENFIETVTKSVPYSTLNTISGNLSGIENLCQGEFAFFRSDLNTAEQYLREGIIKTRENAQYESVCKGLFYLLRIYLYRGNREACHEILEELLLHLEIQDFPNRYAIYDIVSGWFYAHLGKADEIASWLEKEEGNEESGLNLLLHNYESMVKLKKMYSEKLYEKCLEYIKSDEIMEGICRYHMGLLEISIMEAVLFYSLGKNTDAINSLEKAYLSAKDTGFEMPFIEIGEPNLLNLAINSPESGIPVKWLESLKEKASVYRKNLNRMKEYFTHGGSEENKNVLTSREKSIIYHLSMGFGREEIAEEFSLSINTLRSQIRKIYRKLGAVNRADAVRIAINSGIIDKEN